MPIAVCSCLCGGTNSLLRNFLRESDYSDWLNIPIAKGREKTLMLLERLPNYPEVEMLANFVRGASKWAVIIGWDDQGCKWGDISHGGTKAAIDTEAIVRHFA